MARGTRELPLPASVDRFALSVEFDRALAAVEERWPDAPVRDDAFAAHVRTHLGAERDLAVRLPRLQIAEMFLVWWAMQSPAGVAAFLDLFGQGLAKSIACVTSRYPHVEPSSLLQRLVDELFGGEAPRALEFTGFGSLAAWVDVVATQSLLDAVHAVTTTSRTFWRDTRPGT